jgi:PAS domain S-box-containing protein
MEQEKPQPENSTAEESPFYTASDWNIPFDAVNEAIWILNREQRIIRTNRSAELLFGKPKEEMQGKYCWEFTGCKEKTSPECPCIRSRSSHSREKLEFKRGTDWFQAISDPIFDHNDHYAGSVHFFRKITHRRQTEKALIDSENRYRTLFSEMLNGCALHEVICDEGGKPVDYRYLDVNPAFEEITGFRAKDLLGKTALEIAPDIDPFLIETYGRVALTGEPVSFDFHNNNSGRHYVISAYQPEPGQFACIFQNITELKQVEEKLKKNEERYKEIVEGTDDLIIKVDNTGCIVFANHMANRIFGIPQHDIIGMHISNCIHPDDKQQTRTFIDETVSKRGTSTTFENRQVSQTGEIRHLLWTSNFHYDKDGNLIEVASIARDITQRRKMEVALKKAHDELEQRVIERTHEIAKANEDLQVKTKNLEELNTALKILLERREKDKEENNEKILLNVKELLVPYINRLKSGPLNDNQKNYLEVLESGLQEIISPFAQKLTSRYMHVTPRELQVGNLVKQGKTSKEIADTLHTTERTVVAHRANLRKKLGINKTSNLRTYLLSLQ